MTVIQKINSIRILLFIVAVLFIGGCKNDSPTEPEKTNRELLIQTWDLKQALDIGTDPSHPADVTKEINYAYLQFNEDGSYTSSIQNGKWELDDINNQIIFDKNTSAQLTADIIKLASDTLRFKMEIPFVNTPSLYQFTFTVDKNAGSRSPELNFETLWKGFDENYSFFEIKNINWDSVYAVYRPQVNSSTTDIQLFNIFKSILSIFKDGHVNLFTPVGNYGYSGWYTDYPANFLGASAISKYLSKDYGKLANNNIWYGKIGTDIGYIYIGPNFNGDYYDWSNSIDVVIDSLISTKGIIIDIRNNGGGSDNLAKAVASRFTDQTKIFSYVRWRNGPKHSDFTDYEALTISPLGRNTYSKPVVVLTNRHCFSSAEEFLLMMESLPQVSVIGDTTGGGSGNPLIRQLPNGWTYWVPHWIQYTAEKEIYEGIGLAPYIHVSISDADSTADKDTILESALQYLSK